jgi:pyruvate/2-oxoglutarate dehydrogenase complex dihydrolipoamide dehydrogenase (E3) component
MFMAAQHREMFHGSAATGEGYGVTVGKVEFDWVGLKKRRDAYVKRLNGVYEGGWTKAGVDVKMGMATMTAPHTIKIALVGGGEEVIEAKNVLVATGGCVPSYFCPACRPPLSLPALILLPPSFLFSPLLLLTSSCSSLTL